MNKKQINKIYYVYCYLDPRKPLITEYNNEIKLEYEPFYIGKGSKNRMYAHLQCKSKNKYLNNKIKKILNLGLQPIILKLYENLDEDISYEIEEKLILHFGRLYENTGTLLNVQPGGRGKIGFSEEAKIKISNANKNRKMSEEEKQRRSLYYKGENNGMYGKTHTDEAKEKMSKNRSGKKHTEETKQHLSKIRKGKKYHSPEQIEILKNYMTNRIVSDETKTKMSKAKSGKILNIEQRKKLTKNKNVVNKNYYLYNIDIIYDNKLNNFLYLYDAINFLKTIICDDDITDGMYKNIIINNNPNNILQNIQINCYNNKKYKRILTDIEKEQILNMYEDVNLTLNDINKKLNISIKYIKEYLLPYYAVENLKQLAQLKNSKKSKFISDDIKNKILYEFIHNNMIIKDLSIHFKLSVNTIKSFLKSYYNIDNLNNLRYKIINGLI